MKRRHIVFSALAAATFLILYVLYYLYGGSTAPKGQQPLVSLNGSNLSSLKDAFNADFHGAKFCNISR